MSESVYNNFLGLPPELSSYENSKVALIQAPLENTTSFQHGTALGPQAFIKASQQVELYDIESGCDFSEIGAVTFTAPDFRGMKSEQACARIQADVEKALERGLWPITVGGEHTITYGPAVAIKKKYPDVTILHIDAHADLRETYEGSPFSHACILRRIFDMKIPFVSVGIRNYSRDEAELIKKHGLHIYHDFEIQRDGMNAKKICSHLGKNVYLTIDIDGFTPAEFPGKGTPEPGGLSWWQGIELFKYAFKHHNIVGMDINEIMPLPNEARTEFAAAKLAYKLMGYKFFPKETLR